MDNKIDLFQYDLANNIFTKLGMPINKKWSLHKRIFFVWTITWLPVFLLSFVQDVAYSAKLEESFLVDFAAYAQFFIAIPLFLIAEFYINSVLGEVTNHFISSGLISDKDSNIFQQTITKLNKVSSKWSLEVFAYLISIIMTLSWFLVEVTNGNTSWHALVRDNIERVSYAGLWDCIISVPLFNFFLLRCILKFLFWIYLLWKVSQLDLKLNAMHPDKVAGLGFLEIIHIPFAVLIFGTGISIAAVALNQIVTSGNTVFQWPVLAPVFSYIIIAPIIFVVPLFFFYIKLLKEKERAHLELSEIYLGYLNDMRMKGFVKKDVISINQFLEEVDHKSLFSLSATLFVPPFDNIHNMRLVPLDLKSMGELFISAIAPMFPVILKIPEIHDIVLKVISFIGL